MLRIWLLISSALAHPDYLASFNELAVRHPERVLAESDLDWGQDLDRASIRLRTLHAQNVGISYFGTARLDRAGLPPYHELISCQRSQDWAVISIRTLFELKRKATTDSQAASLILPRFTAAGGNHLESLYFFIGCLQAARAYS